MENGKEVSDRDMVTNNNLRAFERNQFQITELRAHLFLSNHLIFFLFCLSLALFMDSLTLWSFVHKLLWTLFSYYLLKGNLKNTENMNKLSIKRRQKKTKRHRDK